MVYQQAGEKAIHICHSIWHIACHNICKIASILFHSKYFEYILCKIMAFIPWQTCTGKISLWWREEKGETFTQKITGYFWPTFFYKPQKVTVSVQLSHVTESCQVLTKIPLICVNYGRHPAKQQLLCTKL